MMNGKNKPLISKFSRPIASVQATHNFVVELRNDPNTGRYAVGMAHITNCGKTRYNDVISAEFDDIDEAIKYFQTKALAEISLITMREKNRTKLVA